MAGKGPLLFSGIGKQAKDLLTRDYSSDQKFSVSSQSYSGLAITSTSVKKGGLSSGDVAAQYRHKNAVFDVKFDTESNVATILTVADILPSAKVITSVKLPDYNSAKLEVQYFHQHVTLTTAVGLKQSPAIDLSATFGTLGTAFGVEATYDTASGNFPKYNTGFSMTKPDSVASLVLADKGDSLKVSYLHHLDQLNRGAMVGEISRKFSTNENTLIVGCSCFVNPHTLVKAKLNNHGNLAALVQHEIKPKSYLTVSGAFDTKAMEKYPKFGLALSLKP